MRMPSPPARTMAQRLPFSLVSDSTEAVDVAGAQTRPFMHTSREKTTPLVTGDACAHHTSGVRAEVRRRADCECRRDGAGVSGDHRIQRARWPLPRGEAAPGHR